VCSQRDIRVFELHQLCQHWIEHGHSFDDVGSHNDIGPSNDVWDGEPGRGCAKFDGELWNWWACSDSERWAGAGHGHGWIAGGVVASLREMSIAVAK
jgi:hypothetical protein